MCGPDSLDKKFTHIARWPVLAVAVVLAGMPALQAENSATDWREGTWEIVARTEVPHAAYAMPPERYSKCISREKMNPAEDVAGQNCRLLDKQVSGSAYRWRMRCLADGQAMDVEGEAVYAGELMQGRVRMVSGKMTRITEINGRHVGPCR